MSFQQHATAPSADSYDWSLSSPDSDHQPAFRYSASLSSGYLDPQSGYASTGASSASNTSLNVTTSDYYGAPVQRYMREYSGVDANPGATAYHGSQTSDPDSDTAHQLSGGHPAAHVVNMSLNERWV